MGYDQIGVSFLQCLSHFQRYAYVRQAHAKEKKTVQQQDTRVDPGFSVPVTYGGRVHSNSVVNGTFS